MARKLDDMMAALPPDRLQRIDALGVVLEGLDLAVVGRAEKFLGEAEHIGSGKRSSVCELSGSEIP